MSPSEIKELRNRMGISQQELADAIHDANPLLKPDRNIVSRWERGVATPSIHYKAELDKLNQAARS